MYSVTVGTWDLLTEKAAYPSCQPNLCTDPCVSFTHFEELALSCLSIGLTRQLLA